MTTWAPTHEPNLWGHPFWAFPAHSRAMLADHPWDVTLTSRLFPSGSLMVVRTTAFPTLHAWIPRDLGIPLLVTGMWLENHLFCPSSMLECQGSRPPRPASMPPPPRLPLSVSLEDSASSYWTSQRTQPSGPHHDLGQRPRPRTGQYNGMKRERGEFFTRGLWKLFEV